MISAPPQQRPFRRRGWRARRGDTSIQVLRARNVRRTRNLARTAVAFRRSQRARHGGPACPSGPPAAAGAVSKAPRLAQPRRAGTGSRKCASRPHRGRLRRRSDTWGLSDSDAGVRTVVRRVIATAERVHRARVPEQRRVVCPVRLARAPDVRQILTACEAARGLIFGPAERRVAVAPERHPLVLVAADVRRGGAPGEDERLARRPVFRAADPHDAEVARRRPTFEAMDDRLGAGADEGVVEHAGRCRRRRGQP